MAFSMPGEFFDKPTARRDDQAIIFYQTCRGLQLTAVFTQPGCRAGNVIDTHCV